LLKGRTQCWIELGEPWRWQLYMSLVATVLFIIPALIISLCYAIIVKTIWEKGTYMGTKARGRKGQNGRTDDDDDRGSRRASSRGIIPRAKVKTVKMTFVIVIVFIACWSPYIVFDLLQVFDQIPKTQTNIAVATFIQSLAPLNSAANPLIYCMFSTQIWKTFRLVELKSGVSWSFIKSSSNHLPSTDGQHFFGGFHGWVAARRRKILRIYLRMGVSGEAPEIYIRITTRRGLLRHH
jgi:7 transmembrane receptor (rhodopsin family)